MGAQRPCLASSRLTDPHALIAAADAPSTEMEGLSIASGDAGTLLMESQASQRTDPSGKDGAVLMATGSGRDARQGTHVRRGGVCRAACGMRLGMRRMGAMHVRRGATGPQDTSCIGGLDDVMGRVHVGACACMCVRRPAGGRHDPGTRTAPTGPACARSGGGCPGAARHHKGRKAPQGPRPGPAGAACSVKAAPGRVGSQRTQLARRRRALT